MENVSNKAYDPMDNSGVAEEMRLLAETSRKNFDAKQKPQCEVVGISDNCVPEEVDKVMHFVGMDLYGDMPNVAAKALNQRAHDIACSLLSD